MQPNPSPSSAQRANVRRGMLATLLALVSSACASFRPDTRSYVVRLRPGQELKAELQRFARDEELRAASIVSAVGSLTNVSLRFANQPEAT